MTHSKREDSGTKPQNATTGGETDKTAKVAEKPREEGQALEKGRPKDTGRMGA
jgi:hypothetical protein